MTIKWIESQFGDNEDWESEEDWKPEGAGEIQGRVVGKTTIDTKYGPTVLLKLQNDDGVFKVWGSRAGLRTLFEDYDDELTLGREVALRCKEKITLKSGNTYVPYEIGFGDVILPAASSVGTEEPF